MDSLNLRVPFNDVSRRYMSSESIESKIYELIQNGPYLNGNNTSSFQSRFAAFIGTKFCVGVSSGTTALELALASLSLPKQSKVLIAANAGGYGSIAINKNHLLPIYSDVNDDGLLDLQSILDASSEISAVIVTHLYGQTVQLDKLCAALKSRNIFLIEDCAQAVGAFIGDKRAGSFGDVSAFSFYPTKNLGAIGDAGAVCTSDSMIFERLNKLREYGWSSRYFSEYPLGSNNRIDEIQALVLDTQLNRVDEWNARRRAIWQRYNLATKKSGLRLLGSNSQSFVAHLAVIDSTNRDRFMNFMNKSGIDTAIHYPYPDYVQPGLSHKTIHKSLYTTERLCSSVVSIPIFPEMTESEISKVENALGQYKE